MTALVTGGGGFLGGAVVRKLLARGEAVRSFTRSNYPWLTDLGVQQVNGDLTNADDVRRAVSGCGVVYHVAAKAGVWGRPADFFSTNVTGTRNVLDACRAENVNRLVYTVRRVSSTLAGTSAGRTNRCRMPRGSIRRTRSRRPSPRRKSWPRTGRRWPPSRSARTWCGGLATRT